MRHNKTILNSTQEESPQAIILQKKEKKKANKKQLAFASNLVSANLACLNHFKN